MVQNYCQALRDLLSRNFLKLFFILAIMPLLDIHADNFHQILGDPPNSYMTSPYGVGDFERSLSVDGLMRRFLIHVPKSYKKGTPIPVVLVFHGGGGNADQQRWSSMMDITADEKGFIAVYPEGTGRFEHRMYAFNVGPGYGYPWKEGINDVHFVEALINDLERLFHVDKKRVFSTGLSNGAMMSYRIANDLGDRIAAIAPVGGALSEKWLSSKKPCSIIHFHGLKDEHFPFNGGLGKGIAGSKENAFSPVMETILSYVKKNGAPVTPIATKAVGNAMSQTWGPGQDGAEVVLWTVKDGGHTWPGGRHRLKALGNVNKDISANLLMWEFFEKHPLK